jgi:glycosyltransferase involved in cell wall biosynthesis
MDESRLHVIPHGAFEHYRALASTDRQSSSAKRLLFFGNLQPYKGVDILLQAFSRLSEDAAASTRLMIAGRPIMDPKPLFELARQLGIEDRVDWDLRPIPEEEVAQLFRDSAAVVLPYREIDQSGVLMTAIAFGKPVIATTVGGIPETVQDGVHGYLVPAGDADELARAASRLLSSGEQLRKMEQAMRDLCIGRFSWNTIAASTTNLYRKLLGHAESLPATLRRPHEVQSALGKAS